ncbi:Smr/MutS family protein [Sphingomonas sp.]|uniref:Smr/MutS family protein n=1 Tax=Sphingomonas sp. TaxID=28214 RepID=UPI0025D9C343|nr:Smr/MutS family protein [Sphingomonas sp.]
MTPEERALWARVTSTVKPIARNRADAPAPLAPPVRVHAPGVAPPVKLAKASPPPPRVPPAARPVQDTLDGGWDRRLGRGMIGPDASLDLHGHTLESAHAMLEAGLARAIARGDRLLLLITGKPPRPDARGPYARGAIRAAVPGWIAASPHGDRIAAVRNAHPRHGGQGALYIVLRRDRQVSRLKS